MKITSKALTCSFLACFGLSACALEDEDLDLDLDLQLEDEAVDGPGPADPAASDELLSDEPGIRPYAYPAVECTSYNVIGVLDEPGPDSSCDLRGSLPAGNWTWSAMYSDSNPDMVAWTEPVPGDLGKYCLFEYVGPGPVTDDDYYQLFDIIDGSGTMSLDSVAIDCRGEVVQGPEGINDPSVTANLQRAFEDSIDWLDASVLLGQEQDRRFTRVAVVDTAAAGASPVNQHGVFMADIIEHIACSTGSADCGDEITYNMAMPRDAYEAADWASGGNYGTMGDLGRAIVGAVGQWRMDRLADPLDSPPRLVINLSLGWTPDGALYNTDPTRGPAMALKSALEFASCNGAVVVAAAGNVDDPNCPNLSTGPLAPAAFEQLPAPSPGECAAMGYAAIDENKFPVHDFAERPLVLAVGGLTGAGDPIPNARPGAMPRIAGHASQVTVESGGGVYTTPVTGTSGGAAVAAGALSLAWSYQPELTPYEIGELLYEGGVDTNLLADFDFAGVNPQVRRISVCGTLDLVCAGLPAAACPSLSCNTDPAPADGHLSEFFATVDNVLADPTTPLVEVAGADTGKNLLCFPQSWSEQIEPQPEHPLCPDCMVDVPPGGESGDDSLVMMIDASSHDTVANPITSVTLTTYDVVGSPTVYDFPEALATINDTTQVTVVTFEAGDAASASLSFGLTNGRNQDGPIPVRIQ